MPTDRTSAGDPARTIALLWRTTNHDAPKRPGPKARLTVDDVVRAATELADADGLEALTMRRLAKDLQVGPMTLYGYVPGREELVDLMLDAAYLAMPREPFTKGTGWRTRVRRVAEANAALYERHPWAAHISTARPPLGPGQLAKYEHELSAFDGTGLSAVETDAALTFVLGFVQSAATAAQATAPQPDDAAWWAAAGPELQRRVTAEDYPRATRIGTAAGEAQGTAYDPRRAFAFGLERALDGLAALVEEARRR